MEGQNSPFTELDPLASRSATALRELEQRAREALEASRSQVARLESEITSQLESIAAVIAEERSQQISQHDWKSQLEGFEHKLHEQQTIWNEQRTAWSAERAGLEKERDELQQKFDLALQDVQRFRSRASDLEEELARRPETGATDSAELVALRAERDALTERVELLERQPAQQPDADSEQQLADLQRRFELAVEDVRELKTKNAKLELRLAAAASAPAHAADATDADSMDWESQKRRLLASLEGGDDHHDPARKQERASIASTIEMTDAVVAEKDREIAKLKAMLEGRAFDEDHDVARERQIDALVNADEVIAEHRARIVQLEREMEEKLRAAELELSVERAKIAREKAELEQWRAELEAQRVENGLGVPGHPGAPRKRWLSKLGLNGEET